jgi:hypothetical protein
MTISAFRDVMSYRMVERYCGIVRPAETAVATNSSANMPTARQQIHNKQQWSNWEVVFSTQSVAM